MSSNTISRRLKSILLLAGAFTFAFLFGEMVHELGHYLAHLAFGNTSVRIHLDPFGGSRIVGVRSLPLNVMGVTSAAGPLFNLVIGMVCLFVMRRTRRPELLPLLLWGPVAMIQEGVTFSLGLLTPGGDAQWIIATGVPVALILTVGILWLLAGLVAVSLLLASTVLNHSETFWTKLGIVLVGMTSLILIRAIHAFVVVPTLSTENLVPLIFSLLLAVIVVALHKPLASLLNQAPEKSYPVAWPTVVTTTTSGTAMFLFQVALSHLF